MRLWLWVIVRLEVFLVSSPVQLVVDWPVSGTPYCYHPPLGGPQSSKFNVRILLGAPVRLIALFISKAFAKQSKRGGQQTWCSHFKNMSSPEPTETAPRLSKNKTREKSKKKSKPQPVIVAGSGKNEGDNPHWAYKPPPDSELFDQSLEGETFEWDSIKKDDDLEIWLIRVPDSVGACQHTWLLTSSHTPYR